MTRSEKGLTAVWMFLVCGTLASFAMFDLAERNKRIVAVAVMAVAATKIHFILRHFMELKAGPRAWRLVFAAWTALCAIVITGFFCIAA